MILLVSSKRVGIKRNAMLMIMAISLTGTLMSLSGDIRLSTPSASATGVVVSESKDAPEINKTSLKAIFMVV